MDENRGLFPKPPENLNKDKKRRKGRFSYMDDMRRTADGKYIYTGPCFEYDTEANTRAKVLLILWLLALPAFAAVVISGCFNVPFMRDTWYTVVPYGFELVILGTVLWAVLRITCHGEILRSYVKKQTFGALPTRSIAAIIFSGIGLVGGIIYMIIHGTEGQALACFSYLALKAISIALAALIIPFSKSVKFAETEQKV